MFDFLMLTCGTVSIYSQPTRTTLTIDDDVAFRLGEIQKAEPGKAFKVVVNEVLRRGLENGSNPKAKVPFKIHARPMGLRKDINFDNIEEALDIIEGVNRR